MGMAICMKLSCLPHIRVHVCMCMHVYVCKGIFDLLTHLQPFQIQLQMKTKAQNSTKMSICHRTVNHKKI